MPTIERIPIAAVAEIYSVSVRTVRNWVRRPHRPLRAMRVGRQLYVTPESLAEFEQPVTVPASTRTSERGRQAVSAFMERFGSLGLTKAK